MRAPSLDSSGNALYPLSLPSSPFHPPSRSAPACEEEDTYMSYEEEDTCILGSASAWRRRLTLHVSSSCDMLVLTQGIPTRCIPRALWLHLSHAKVASTTSRAAASVRRPKSLALALRPHPLQNPLQREQTRAEITRRKAAPVGQKESKLVVVDGGGGGGGSS